jgi:hypothetical protein
MTIDKVWSELKRHEGELFYTKTKLEFTYTINDKFLIPSRADYQLYKSNFEKAIKYFPDTSPGELNTKNIRGHSYVYGLLSDKRIADYV